MPKYFVNMVMEVSTQIEVEADDPDRAIEAAFESDDMPGGITVGAFGPGEAVDDSDWRPESVADANHNTVWRDADA